MLDCLLFLGNIIKLLFNTVLPYGITFGSIVVGLVTAPMLVGAIKKIF